MPTLLNKEVPNDASKTIVDLDETKRKLEDSIRKFDSLNRAFIETEARKDIEAYKSHPNRSN